MIDGVQFSITGLDGILGKMAEVKSDIRRKGGRFAARKAAQVVVDAAKANARKLDDPETRESIEKNIAMRFSGRRFKATGDIMFRVGVMGGANPANAKKSKDLPGGATWYWRFKELGTSKIPATPFLRPALEQNISPVIDTFATQYEKALDRAIRRAKKASGKG